MQIKESHPISIKKTAAGLIAVLLLMAAVFSVFFLAEEVFHDGHECEEDCPVCAFIEQCEAVLQQTGGGIAITLSMVVAVFFFLCVCIPEIKHIFNTPVSEKIRLNI